MSFASMNYCHTKGPRHLEDFLDCGNNRSDCRVDLVIATLNGAKAVLVDKVSLHVDYKQCCCGRREVVSIWASIQEGELDWRSHVDNPKRKLRV